MTPLSSQDLLGAFCVLPVIAVWLEMEMLMSDVRDVRGRRWHQTSESDNLTFDIDNRDTSLQSLGVCCTFPKKTYHNHCNGSLPFAMMNH